MTASITDDLPVTQSAVAQHLRVLREAQLVAARAEGTRRPVRGDRIEFDGLASVRAWVDSFWDDALEAD